MKFLLIGSGAREHAIAWKLAKSEVVTELFAWPGNPAMYKVAKRVDMPKEASLEEVSRFVQEQGIEIVVVGPELYLAQGIADIMAEKKISCFGPKKEVAQLESSKAYAKNLMAACKIPTAKFKIAKTKQECSDFAHQQLKNDGAVVLKASGLAAGKGVFVCALSSEVDSALERLYSEQMAKASDLVVVEERLVGRECSYFAFIGQGAISPLGFAVDFKRLLDGDKGPNTGGMGCYTPVPWLPSDAAHIVNQKIIDPLLKGLRGLGLDYCGCLYVGLMWAKSGPRVVEFNVRLGDPEAQVIAVCDKNDWGALIAKSVGVNIKTKKIKGKDETGPEAAVGVVLASSGYPYGDIENAREAELSLDLFNPEDSKVNVFGASIKERPDENTKVFTSKGRVLTVVGKGPALKQARDLAYNRLERIVAKWPEAKWRRDIADRVIKEGF